MIQCGQESGTEYDSQSDLHLTVNVAKLYTFSRREHIATHGAVFGQNICRRRSHAFPWCATQANILDPIYWHRGLLHLPFFAVQQHRALFSQTIRHLHYAAGLRDEIDTAYTVSHSILHTGVPTPGTQGVGAGSVGICWNLNVESRGILVGACAWRGRATAKTTAANG